MKARDFCIPFNFKVSYLPSLIKIFINIFIFDSENLEKNEDPENKIALEAMQKLEEKVSLKIFT